MKLSMMVLITSSTPRAVRNTPAMPAQAAPPSAAAASTAVIASTGGQPPT